MCPSHSSDESTDLRTASFTSITCPDERRCAFHLLSQRGQVTDECLSFTAGISFPEFFEA